MTLRSAARPSAENSETLGGHFHFIWDISESLVFHFNYTCLSFVLLSTTPLSLAGHLVSKVSSECFVTDLSEASFYKTLVLCSSAQALTLFATSMSLNKDSHCTLSIAVH